MRQHRTGNVEAKVLRFRFELGAATAEIGSLWNNSGKGVSTPVWVMPALFDQDIDTAEALPSHAGTNST